LKKNADLKVTTATVESVWAPKAAPAAAAATAASAAEPSSDKADEKKSAEKKSTEKKSEEKKDEKKDKADKKINLNDYDHFVVVSRVAQGETYVLTYGSLFQLHI